MRLQLKKKSLKLRQKNNFITFEKYSITYFVSINGNFVKQTITTKSKTMSNLLYTVAVILVIFWAIGFFAYSLGSIIHILLVIAIIAVLLRLIQGKRPV